jgi:hypothetical protein
MAVYSRDDDVPAIRLFRPLAEKGSAKGARRIREDVRKGVAQFNSPHQRSQAHEMT